MKISVKYDALKRELDEREEREGSSDFPNEKFLTRPGGAGDIDNVRLNEGRGRFFVEAKNVAGGSLLLLKGTNISFILHFLSPLKVEILISGLQYYFVLPPARINKRDSTGGFSQLRLLIRAGPSTIYLLITMRKVFFCSCKC